MPPLEKQNYPNCNSYVYQFSHVVPDTPDRMEAYGAFHTGDVSYWLNYYSTTWNRPWTDVDFDLGDMMSSYIAEFAAHGRVDGWPVYHSTESTFEYMHIEATAKPDTLDTAKAALWVAYWTSADKG